MELSLRSRPAGEFTVLEVGGEIDVYTAPALRDRLGQLADSGVRHIVVDLSAVEFLDSTGLGVLVGALKRAGATGGVLRLVCAQERILKIFRITGLEDVFGIVGTIEDAMAVTDAAPPQVARGVASAPVAPPPEHRPPDGTGAE